jgi:hypothetical protein
MRISQRTKHEPETFVAPVRVRDWNRLNSTFQAITGYYTQNLSETSGPLPEKLTQALVGPRFLEVWGMAPALGRAFSPAEEHFGGPDAALISDLSGPAIAADPARAAAHTPTSRRQTTK